MQKGKGKSKNRKFDKRGTYPRRQDDRRYDKREEDTRSADGGRNDVSWYSRNPNLLVAAGSFPYPYRPGMELKLGEFSDPGSAVGTAQRGLIVPGVMTLDWIPAIGTSNTVTDPASVLGKEIYARVRRAYSGDLAADGPDYVMYILALSSIFSYIAWLKRLYRVLNVWTPDNYMLPDAVIGAMGFTQKDIVSLRTNRMKLWQCINELVLQSRKFTCPSSIDLVNRHYWMSDNVYTDEQTINSQFYMFNLVGVFKFAMLNMADGNPGPGLAMTPMPTVDVLADTQVMTVETLYTFGLDLLQALSEWDGAYVINGYLKRAFEGDAMFMVDELPLEQPFTPVYVPEVLMQIENSRGLIATNGSDLFSIASKFNITQNVTTNSVVANPTYSIHQSKIEKSVGQADTIPPILSIRSDAPTVADSVVASRLQMGSEVVGTTGEAPQVNYQCKIHCATEIAFEWRLFNGFDDTYGSSLFNARSQLFSNTMITQYPTIDATSGTVKNTGAVWMQRMFQAEQFDWHPFMFFTYMTTVSTVDKKPRPYFAIVGDTHNITTISQQDLDNLHRVCIYSELNSFGF